MKMAQVPRRHQQPSSSLVDSRHHLPQDPHSPSYLIICYVCKELAKPNNEHSLHYGGIVCLSCRAFFRRAHQKSKAPQFVCKNNNRCDVTVLNRRRCQKCRYDRCLLAGMTPDAVLTEEERGIRFRKTLERKKQRQASGQSTDGERSPVIGDDSVSRSIPDDDLDAFFENIYQSSMSPDSPRLEEIFQTLDSTKVIPTLPACEPGTARFKIGRTVEEVELTPDTEPKVVQRFNRDTRPVHDLLQPGSFVCTKLEIREKIERSPSRETSRLEELIRYQEDLSPCSSTHSQASGSFRLQEIMEGYGQQPSHTSSSPLNSEDESPPLLLDPCAVAPKSSGATFTINAPVLEGLIHAFDNSNLNQLVEDGNMLISPSPSMADLEYSEAEMDFDTTSFENFESDFEAPDFQLESLVQTYQISVGQISNQPISTFAEVIKFDKKVIFNFLSEVTKQYTKFAILQRAFSDLKKEDQDRLLGRNTQLFIHLCFACDLIASHTKPVLPPQGFFIQTGVQNVFQDNSFIDLSRNLHLKNVFKSGVDLTYLSRLINSLRTIKDITSVKIRSVLSYCILFAHDDSQKLSETKKINEILTENENLLRRITQSQETFKHLETILNQITVFCAYNVAWDVPNITSKSIDIPYSDDEELWLKSHFQNLDLAYKSVGWGEEMTKEFMMYSLEVPVSKKFMKGVFEVELERLWRAFKMFPDFQALPYQVQVDIMNKNGPAGLAVRVAEYEACKGGLQQIRGAFGAATEEELWKENYWQIFHGTDSVKKMKMKDVANQRSVSLNHDQMLQFEILCRDFAGVVSDPIYYKLMTLIALTRATGQGASKELLPLQSFYLMQLRRRTEWMFRTDNAQKGRFFSRMKDPETLMQKVQVCVNNLDKLAQILIFIKNQR